MRRSKTLLFVLLVVAPLAACSDSGGGGAADTTTTTGLDEETTSTTDGSDGGGGSADDLAAAIAETFNEESTLTTPEQRLCAGEAFVEIVGADELAASGITPEDVANSNPADFVDVSEAQALAFLAATDDCGIDIEEEFARNLAAGAEDADAALACVRDALDDGLVSGFFVATFTLPSEDAFNDPRVAELFSAIEPCNLNFSN